MFGQPDNPFKRSRSVSSTIGDDKLDDYIENLNSQIQDETETLFNESQQLDDAFQTNLCETDVSFYYFIGRLNPPHNGHIAALTQLVTTANENNSIPLILLGSGPKKIRTLDNPITFELKSAFIRHNLAGEYIIQEMQSPSMDVSQYIVNDLQTRDIKQLSQIHITHVAGDKAEDSTKLNFIQPIAVKAVKAVASTAVVDIKTCAIVPVAVDGVEMSATLVRKDVYNSLIDGTGIASFRSKYGWFYKEFTDKIYSEIIEPAIAMSREDIQLYISTGQLPMLSTGKKRKLGGSCRKRTNRKRTNNAKQTRKKCIYVYK